MPSELFERCPQGIHALVKSLRTAFSLPESTEGDAKYQLESRFVSTCCDCAAFHQANELCRGIVQSFINHLPTHLTVCQRSQTGQRHGCKLNA